MLYDDPSSPYYVPPGPIELVLDASASTNYVYNFQFYIGELDGCTISSYSIDMDTLGPSNNPDMYILELA